MAFCGNCGAEVASDAAYCPRCGFRGMADTMPVVPAGPPAYESSPELALLPLRRLSWGLILLAAYMGIIAWSGIQEAFFPAPPSAPVYLVDMPAPLVLVNLLIIVVPLAMLLFITLGLRGLWANVPEIKSRLTLRVGSRTLSATRLMAYLFAAIILSFIAEGAVVILSLVSGVAATDMSLFYGASFEALIVAFGWSLMVFPAKALGPWTTPVESRVVSVAILVISAAAVFDVAAQFAAAFVLAPGAAASGGSSMGPVPWAQGISALGAFAGLLAVAWINRRIIHRMLRAPGHAVAAPA